jgi:thioredoxin 1
MKKIVILVSILILVTALSCATKTTTRTKTTTKVKQQVTFIELGSVNCIPCKQMQPIMKAIEEKYAGKVKVVFYDVIKQKDKATEYHIKLMPTQVFLDAKGKEFFRHEGFYPQDEIEKLIDKKLAPKK